MKLPINTFKKSLQEKKIQFGLWLGLADSSCAEICASAGFDWLLVDCEHACFSERDVLHHLQAIAAYNSAPIVRAASQDPAHLKKLLDVGAQSLLIPMVDNALQAQALVQAVNYPPKGQRGLGTSMARAARWNGVPSYLTDANQEIFLIVQAETIEAIDNLDSILAVEGVDAVFIGPSDLSASMGFIGQAGHPDVVDAVTKGIKTITAAGKAAGVLAVDKDIAKHYQEAGAKFIGVGVDASLLAHGVRSLAAQYNNQETGDGPSY